VPAFQLQLGGQRRGEAAGWTRERPRRSCMIAFRRPCLRWAMPRAANANRAPVACTPRAERIQKGLAALGKFDGIHTSIVCGTAGGKLFVHSPHGSAGAGDAIAYLNVNKKVTALAAGGWHPLAHQHMAAPARALQAANRRLPPSVRRSARRQGGAGLPAGGQPRQPAVLRRAPQQGRLLQGGHRGRGRHTGGPAGRQRRPRGCLRRQLRCAGRGAGAGPPTAWRGVWGQPPRAAADRAAAQLPPPLPPPLLPSPGCCLRLAPQAPPSAGRRLAQACRSPLAPPGAQGFDRLGNDVLWTVSGDQVGALALADVDGNGAQELLVGEGPGPGRGVPCCAAGAAPDAAHRLVLGIVPAVLRADAGKANAPCCTPRQPAQQWHAPLAPPACAQVGSADAQVRIFQQEELLASLQEADAVVALCGLGASRWGYALANGTVGPGPGAPAGPWLAAVRSSSWQRARPAGRGARPLWLLRAGCAGLWVLADANVAGISVEEGSRLVAGSQTARRRCRLAWRICCRGVASAVLRRQGWPACGAAHLAGGGAGGHVRGQQAAVALQEQAHAGGVRWLRPGRRRPAGAGHRLEQRQGAQAAAAQQQLQPSGRMPHRPGQLGAAARRLKLGRQRLARAAGRRQLPGWSGAGGGFCLLRVCRWRRGG
jgi:hypothetical protein